jgi:hypothetical protein
MTNILDLEPDNNTKLVLLGQEVNMYINTRWQLQMRYRVSKNIGADKSVLDSIQADLEKCEKYLAKLDEEAQALSKEK